MEVEKIEFIDLHFAVFQRSHERLTVTADTPWRAWRERETLRDPTSERGIEIE